MSNFKTTFITAQELAKRYRVTTKTVSNWVKQGKIPTPLRIGHSLRWNIDDLTAWEGAKTHE